MSHPQQQMPEDWAVDDPPTFSASSDLDDPDAVTDDDASLFDVDPEPGKLYSQHICLAALRGENIPDAAASAEDIHTLSYPVKLCILRGIRHHDGFGTGLLNTIQTAGQDYACFRRALNARAIMSNRIPDMDQENDPESVPYCIWYPDVAREDTYRDLARRYPQMRYQVGRACAVAGYSVLYKELDLLPDISIAEEAQDSVMRGQRKDGGEDDSGSVEIFQHIVQQPVRWRVMDDYNRTVEIDHPRPVRNYGLNGDTAVVSTLHLKRSFQLVRSEHSRFSEDRSCLTAPAWIGIELAPSYFNITEDWNIDEYTCTDYYYANWPQRPSSQAMIDLLWSPLPFDLPWGDKDLLILMAAYHGNIDRYARLRRPYHVSWAESHCVQRGIYHNTAFARWCSINLTGAASSCDIRAAITARFIMSNDLSRVPDAAADTDDNDDNNFKGDLPLQIWYPQLAAEATYRELVLRQPRAMLGPVARACVIAGYRTLWDELIAQERVEPYAELVEECRVNYDRHYFDSLRESCARRGLLDAANDSNVWEERPPIKGPYAANALRAPNYSTVLVSTPRLAHVEWDNLGDERTMRAGRTVRAPAIDLFIAGFESKEAQPLKKTSEDEEGFDNVDLEELYLERREPGGGKELDAYRKRGQSASNREHRIRGYRPRGGRRGG
ncbi:hypothetical protein V8F20_006073 [Naviculisporaceae sp. PSN 640]